jgi:CRP-like cAMP-binding protein
MNTQSFPPGKRIFGKGEDGHEAYRILKGTVEIFVGEGESKVILAELGQGEIFGEMGMIEQRPRSATARAIDAVDAEVITRDDFNQSLVGGGEILIPYLTTIFERLRVTNERLRDALEQLDATRSAEASIAEGLALSATVGAPTLRIEPDSDEMRAQSTLKARQIEVFPFLLGRRGEVAGVDFFEKNHLLITDTIPYRISRNHCLIDRNADTFLIRDRGSRRGTLVNGALIGGTSGFKSALLNPGENTLVLGGSDSLARFKLIVPEEAPIVSD